VYCEQVWQVYCEQVWQEVKELNLTQVLQKVAAVKLPQFHCAQDVVVVQLQEKNVVLQLQEKNVVPQLQFSGWLNFCTPHQLFASVTQIDASCPVFDAVTSTSTSWTAMSTDTIG
jgi:uncharacterized protein YihD (DUF1040 family)